MSLSESKTSTHVCGCKTSSHETRVVEVGINFGKTIHYAIHLSVSIVSEPSHLPDTFQLTRDGSRIDEFAPATVALSR